MLKNRKKKPVKIDNRNDDKIVKYRNKIVKNGKKMKKNDDKIVKKIVKKS